VESCTAGRRPYTIHDLLELDDGYHRFELLDGTLIMSPAPGYDHQEFPANLHMLPVRRVPQGVKVHIAGNVRLFGSDENGLVPDLAITRPGVSTRGRTRLEAEEVLCVVEVVCPGSRRLDRVTKPSAYAEAGIPFLLRVELAPFPGQLGEQVPVILVHGLHQGWYRAAERLTAGATGKIMRSFPVEFDPAELLDEDWPERFLERA
jgi:Protein of unknown function (DUF820).